MDVDATAPHGEEHNPQDDVIARMLSVLASEMVGKDDVQRAQAAAYNLAQRGEAGIEALAEVVLNWGDYGPFALYATIQALGGSGNAKAVTVLRRIVLVPPTAGHDIEKRRALSALGYHGEAGASVLAEIVENPRLASQAWEAGSMLGSTGDEKIALRPLIAALSRPDSPLVAMDAANGLGKLKSLAAIPALIQAMAEDDPIGNSAKGALYQFGEAAIPALIQAMATESDVIRQRTAWILSWQAQNARAFEGLRAVLEDADADVRWAAISAMHRHGGSDVLPALERMRARSQENSENFDPLGEEVQEAIQAIKARSAEAVQPSVLDDEPPVLEAFDPDWYDQPPRTTAEEIDHLLSELAGPIVDQEDRNWAGEIAYSLLLQGPPGVAALSAVAGNHDLDSDARLAALDALALSDDEATVLPPLLEALHDPEAWLATRAAYALGKLGAVAAIPDLVDALADDDAYGEGAKKALIQIGHQASIPALLVVHALLVVLAHGPERKRRAAAATLREMPADPRLAEAFMVALRDPDPVVRRLAIEGISFPHDGWVYSHKTSMSWSDFVRSDPSVAKAIQPLLDDPDESVRRAAGRGLQAVGGQDDALLLKRASRHTSQEKDRSSNKNDPGQPTVSSDFPQNIVPYLRLLARGASGMADARPVWRAAQALGRLGAPGVDTLAAILQDPDLYSQSSRLWAIDALGASGDTHALSPLLDTLRTADALRAAYALARLGAPGLAVLNEVIEDSHATTLARHAAEDALSHPLRTRQR